ncbi:MAG: UDP-glucuronosyltransferase [Candidatus Sericytochromatia bacterium]|nr:MAG: UDP-glucuronosyltransferase [Candidatus Sericytochromatia bacterium]
MKKKNILVIYSCAGGGHYSTAKAIEKALNEKYPQYNVILLDGPKLTGSKIINFLNDIYDYLLRTNTKFCIWGFGLLNASRGDKSLVNFFPKVVERVSKYFKSLNPDIILSVNSGVNAFISEIFKKNNWDKKIPFIICCTDPTKGFVKGWVHPEVDLMLAPLEICKNQLVEYGMPENKIRVLNGVPINPSFTNDSKSKEEAREILGLDKNKFTALITSGGVGTKEVGIITKYLDNTNLDIQLIVCCGKNEKQTKELTDYSSNSRLKIKVIGFTQEMNLLMDACDIVIGKPGPAIIAEATAKKRPLILEALNGVMIQERGNLEYALENKIALKANNKEDIRKHIKSFIENKNLYSEIVENMSKIDNSNAVYKLVDIIVDFSENEFIKIRAEALNKEAEKLNNYTKENPGYLSFIWS